MDSYLLVFIGLIVVVIMCVFIFWLRSLPPAKSQEYVKKRFYRYVVFKPLDGLAVARNSVLSSYGTYLGSIIAETDTIEEARAIRNAYPNPKELNILFRLSGEIVNIDGKLYEVIKKEDEEKWEKEKASFIIGKNVRITE